jgi:hypothetical protein
MAQKGKVTIHQDSLVSQLLRRNALLNETKMSMPGYRIQIYFGTDRNKANEIRTAFIADHNDTPAYLLYHQPNFKVRIGDFKTRLEAVKAMQVISISYSNAFIVKDEIPLPKPEMP